MLECGNVRTTQVLATACSIIGVITFTIAVQVFGESRSHRLTMADHGMAIGFYFLHVQHGRFPPLQPDDDQRGARSGLRDVCSVTDGDT